MTSDAATSAVNPGRIWRRLLGACRFQYAAGLLAMVLAVPVQAVIVALDLVPGGSIDTSRDVNVGASFFADIIIDTQGASLEIAAFDIGFVFDAGGGAGSLEVGAFTATTGAFGAFLSDPVFSSELANGATLNVILFDPAGVLGETTFSGLGVLASIEFKGLTAGAVGIAFDGTVIFDGAFAALQLSSAPAGGSVNVIDNAQGVPAPWTLMLLLPGVVVAMCATKRTASTNACMSGRPRVPVAHFARHKTFS